MSFNSIKSNKGQAVVELAIILSILLIIFGGIIEFGRILNAYLILTHASREGARVGILGVSDGQITDVIKGSVSPLRENDISIDITPGINERISGDTLMVALEYNVSIIFPLIGSFIPDPFTVSAKTLMRME